MIAVIDYGLGNVQAFLDIYKRLNIPAIAAKKSEDLLGVSKCILPGVGAFDWAMQSLENSGMRPALEKIVVQDKLPVLGVCVGMQMLANQSDEGSLKGLGWIPGEIKKFDETKFDRLPHIPHMGWNDVAITRENPLLNGIKDPQFYFLHSYYFAPEDPHSIIGASEYGGRFASAVAKGNVYGTQFHPEKSHHWGMSLLKNFAEL
jgi:glutamine amidotransferase